MNVLKFSFGPNNKTVANIPNCCNPYCLLPAVPRLFTCCVRAASLPFFFLLAAKSWSSFSFFLPFLPPFLSFHSDLVQWDFSVSLI